MSVFSPDTVVGVFDNPAVAEQAMDTLSGAGFEREEMRYLVSDSSSNSNFLEGLKSFFSGNDPTPAPAEDNLVIELRHMGLSNEEVQEYARAYNQGHTILAVKTQGDEQMAMNILLQQGATTLCSTATLSETNGLSEQPAIGHERPVSMEPAPADVNGHNTDEHSALNQATTDAQPMPAATNGHDADTYETQNQAKAVTNQVDTPDYGANYTPDAQSTDVDEDEVETPINMPEYGTSGESSAANVADVNSGTASQSDNAYVARDALQRLQERIQSTRQELEATRSQIEVLKQHETRFQSAQQELQTLQNELLAAQVELQEAQERMHQYQS